jgi:hypothetical protein
MDTVLVGTMAYAHQRDLAARRLLAAHCPVNMSELSDLAVLLLKP